MCENMKFISSVDQDILRVSKANEWDILFHTRDKFGISKHPCIVLFIISTRNYYRKEVLPERDRLEKISPIAPQK